MEVTDIIAVYKKAGDRWEVHLWEVRKRAMGNCGTKEECKLYAARHSPKFEVEEGGESGS